MAAEHLHLSLTKVITSAISLQYVHACSDSLSVCTYGKQARLGCGRVLLGLLKIHRVPRYRYPYYVGIIVPGVAWIARSTGLMFPFFDAFSFPIETLWHHTASRTDFFQSLSHSLTYSPVGAPALSLPLAISTAKSQFAERSARSLHDDEGDLSSRHPFGPLLYSPCPTVKNPDSN